MRLRVHRIVIQILRQYSLKFTYHRARKDGQRALLALGQQFSGRMIQSKFQFPSNSPSPPSATKGWLGGRARIHDSTEQATEGKKNSHEAQSRYERWHVSSRKTKSG